MKSHEEELRLFSDNVIKLLHLNKSDCVVEYWDTEDSLLLATFEYNIIISPQETEGFILEVSFYIDIHPNISAHTVLKLNELPNVELQLLEGYAYDEEGNVVLENDIELGTLDDDATIH